MREKLVLQDRRTSDMAENIQMIKSGIMNSNSNWNHQQLLENYLKILPDSLINLL